MKNKEAIHAMLLLHAVNYSASLASSDAQFHCIGAILLWNTSAVFVNFTYKWLGILLEVWSNCFKFSQRQYQFFVSLWINNKLLPLLSNLLPSIWWWKLPIFYWPDLVDLCLGEDLDPFCCQGITPNVDQWLVAIQETRVDKKIKTIHKN